MDKYIKVCDYNWGEYPRAEFGDDHRTDFFYVNVQIDAENIFDIIDKSPYFVAEQLQGYIDLFEKTLVEYCKHHDISRPESEG